jgi:hypothetical protein
MKLFKYNLIFILSNFVLLKIINYSSNHYWIDNFFIMLWLGRMSLSISFLHYIFNLFFERIKDLYKLLAIYLITHIILNGMVALIDAEHLGFIRNLLHEYEDIEMFFRTTVPFLFSMAITISYYWYKNRITTKKGEL